MKNLIIIFFVSCLVGACGNNNKTEEPNLKETENYPTYDTTQKPDRINDSVSDGGMRSGGDLRHNVDDNQDGQ